MQVGPTFAEDYERACADLRRLGPVVENLLVELLDASDLQIHSVTHRVKTQSSTRRKIEDKEEAYSDFDDLHDLLGARVITFFPDEVDRVADVVTAEFEIDEDNSVDKRALLDPDRFGYLSLHYVASLNQARAALPEHARFKDRKFEIQIRSILQHAWAEIEHDLGYHTPGSIPDSVRRRFSRLAGLLEVADDEFHRLRRDVEEYQAAVDREVEVDPDEVSINRDSVAALVRSSSRVHELDSTLARVSDGPVIEFDNADSFAAGLAGELRAAGLETIGEVNEALDANRELVERFFERWTDDGRLKAIYRGLSLFYLAYVLAAHEASVDEVMRYLQEAHISARGAPGGYRQIAEKVLRCYEEARKET